MHNHLYGIVIIVCFVFLPFLAWAEVDIGAHLGNNPSAETVREYEELTGRHVKSVLLYYSLNPAVYPAFERKKYEEIRYHDGYDTHTIMHIVFEPWVSLSDISSGSYDDYFCAYARAAKDWGEEIRFRFAHEMIHDDNPKSKGWYPWQDHPDEYKAAFRHVYELFRSQGADNVKFVWCPNYHISDVEILKKYYPGKEYVDWIGMDGWGYPDLSFDEVFRKLYDAIVNHPEIFGDKDIMLGEFAAMEGDYKAAWIQDAFNKIKNEYPKIKAFYWFNLDKEHNWKIDSSPEALEAFRQALKDPYFVSHIGPQENTSPGNNSGTLKLEKNCSIPVKVHIPEISMVSIKISQVGKDGKQWLPVEEMDFGRLEFDEVYHIFRASVYFVVDVGIITNQENWKVTHTISPVTNGTDILDENINVVFVSVEDGKENSLAKVSYRESDGLEFDSAGVKKHWLRIYYGFATGKDDAPGVKPIGLDKSSGDYRGVVTITFVVS